MLPVRKNQAAARPRRRSGLIGAGALFGALLLGGLPAAAASAAPTIEEFSVTRSSNIAGAPTDVTVTIALPPGPVSPDYGENVLRRTKVDLPAGLIGDPRGADTCPLPEISGFASNCPATSQVGTVQTVGFVSTTYPLYQIENTDPTVTARLGFLPGGNTPSIFDVRPRSEGDYGLETISFVTGQAWLRSVKVTLWGQPHSAANDSQRGPRAVAGMPEPLGGLSNVRNFMTNGTYCGPLAPARVAVDTYAAPGDDAHATFQLPPLEGCESLQYGARVQAFPTSRTTDSPTGLTTTVDVPVETAVGGRERAHVRRVHVQLPEGIVASASGANGLQACSDAQLNLGQNVDAACPAASRLGTVKVDTPLLDNPLEGTINLRTPLPGQLFRLVILAKGQGVRMKIVGDAVPDPVTGRLLARFDNAPQQPFSRMTVNFDDGPQAALATPMQCGQFTVDTASWSWGGQVETLANRFAIDQGCDRFRQFTPALHAGLSSSTAGSSSTFTLSVSRPEGQQSLGALDVQMPEGLLAHIGQVPLCPDANAAAGTCSSASRIGSAQAAVGSGPQPLWVPERGKAPTHVFLGGPYKGAPYSLSIVVPAQAGPFDLGTVVVRAALHVDRKTARVTVKSDPIPSILQGVPLRIQQVRVHIDRAGFMRAPTNCEATTVTSTVRAVEGAGANAQSRFQVGDCASLSMKPKLKLRFTNKTQMTRGKHPGIEATVTQRKGEAGMRRAEVALPLSVALDPDNARALCTPAQAEARTCPEGSIVGSAEAKTPLLSEPLKGPVYFVEGTRTTTTGRVVKTLPKLWVALKGPIELDVWADSTVKRKKLVSRFTFIPDAPVDSFRLRIKSGKSGILKATGVGGNRMCGSKHRVEASFRGQNGKLHRTNPTAGLACTKKATKRATSGKGSRPTTGNRTKQATR